MKFSGKITSIFILFFLLLSITKNNILYVIYDYDTELFVSMFCENIDRPELECDGKCMLADMQEDQSDNKNIAHVLKQLQTEILYCNNPVSFDFPEKEIISYEKLTISPYLYSYHFLYTRESNEPPRSFS